MVSAWMAVMVLGSWPGESPVGTQRARVDVMEGNQIASWVRVEHANGQNRPQLQYGPMYMNYRSWQVPYRWYRVMDWSDSENVRLDWVRGEPTAIVSTRAGIVMVKASVYTETWGCDTEARERQRYADLRIPSDAPGLPGIRGRVR